MARERTPPGFQRRPVTALPVGLGGLFSRIQSARAATIAAQWRGRIPSAPGPRDWSPAAGPGAAAAAPVMDRTARPRRQAADRMLPAVRVANYCQGGRAQLTGAQVRRVLAKNAMGGGTRAQRRGRVLALHSGLTAVTEPPAERRPMEDVVIYDEAALLL
jgi:hypothetical protein